MKDTKQSLDFQIFVTFETVINLLERRHILNRQIPDLQAMFIDQMKKSSFSIATDRSNNQGLDYVYPIYAYPSKSSTVISIFDTIDTSSD